MEVTVVLPWDETGQKNQKFMAFGPVQWLPCKSRTSTMTKGHLQLAKKGRIRDSNPGPPAPKAGIMPLDQSDLTTWTYPFGCSSVGPSFI